MRRLMFAVAGLLGAAMVAVPATASATPLNVGQGPQIVAAYDFNESYWVHSTTAGNWYETTNGNMNSIDPEGTGTWQLIHDPSRSGKCLTFIPSGSQANEIVDATCNSANPAMQWASASENHSDTTWYFWNRYEIDNESCSGGHKAFITGTGAVSTLYVLCPNASNGAPNDDQQFVFTHV